MKNTCPICMQEIGPQDAVCPACGFKLQGSTQAFSFIQDEQEPAAAQQAAGTAQPAATTEPPMKREMVLTVIRGPQPGVAFVLEDRTLIIGRSPKCDIFLNDMTVSRNHAKIEPIGSAYQITDNESYNGLWVNNDNVHTALLHDGDLLQIGAFGLLVTVR